jgi:vacuolar-type H+-ATPase subunit H
MHSAGTHHHGHGTVKTGPSLLEIVAAHETGLMDQVSEAERNARALLDEAHAEATSYLSEDYAQLEREIAELRRQAAEKRDAEVASIRQACDARVTEIRSQAGQKLDEVFREVVDRVIPRA